MFRILVLLALLLAAPAAAVSTWEPTRLTPGSTSEFQFTGTTDSVTHLDVRQCGSVSYGFEQDITAGGSGTTGAATLVSCPKQDSTLTDCTSFTSVAGDSSNNATAVRPGYIGVDVTGDPTGTSRISVYCGANTFSGGGGGGSRTVTACDSGCDTTVICGATCATAGNSTCQGGSAVEMARLLSPTVANPVTIEIEPGLYQECVALNDMAGLNVINRGTIWPVVTTSNSTNGGVVRVGDHIPATTPAEVLFINEGLIQNDAYSAPESGFGVGQEGTAAGDNVAAGYANVTLINLGTIVGHHDGVQWDGTSTTGPSATDLSRFNLYNNGLIVSGRDAVTKKSNGIDYVGLGHVEVNPVYCVDAVNKSAFLDAQTAAVASNGSGAGDNFVIAAADDYGTDDGYLFRTVTLSDGGGADCGATNACDGITAVVTDYVTATDTLTFDFAAACAEAITTGCNYTIAAMPQWRESPCTTKDWPAIAGTIGATAFWKMTGFHFGVAGPLTANTLDETTIENGTIHMRINASAMGTAACTGQSPIAGVLTHSTPNWTRATLNNLNIDIEINSNQRDPACANPIACVAFTGAAEFGEFNLDKIHCKVRNTADPDENTRGIIANSTQGTPTVTLGDAYIDIDNTVGSYVGTSTALLATTTTLKVVGDVSSPDLLTLEGTTAMSGWKEQCQLFPDAAGAVIANQPFQITDNLVGIKLQAAGCKCYGTCGAAETFNLEDAAGDAIGAAAIACQDNATAITFTDVSTDADGTFAAGTQPTVDDGTLGTLLDDLLVCLRYTTHTW